jgi:hypothetical protein
MPLIDSFVVTERRGRAYGWGTQLHNAAIIPADELARHLADRIMAIRCRNTPHLLAAWRTRAAGGAAHPPDIRAALEAFIQPVFGLQDAPGLPDHVEGFVAQHLWYELTSETGPDDGVVLVTMPAFLVTSPGGDALVIHRDGAVLSFRLWELKKCTGRSTVSGTVSSAFSQIKSNAARYLAQYTGTEQWTQEPEIARFIGTVIEQWLAAAPTASAGVAVNTSNVLVPRRCFTTFGRHFPKFVDPVRLRGLITAVQDFSQFVVAVQGAVWTGL